MKALTLNETFQVLGNNKCYMCFFFLCFCRQLHTPTNILVLSLAISDFLVGLLLMPVEIFRNKSCWFHGDIVCFIYSYLLIYISSTSIGNIVLITVDRYLAICDPLHHAIRFSVVKANIFVCLCWLWYGIYSTFIIKDELIQPGRSNSCTGECLVLINYDLVTIDLIMNFILPVGIIVVLYMKVFLVVVFHARAMRFHVTAVKSQVSVNHAKKKQNPKAHELKAAKTLGVVVFIYLMCYCPFYCFTLVPGNLINTKSAPFLFFVFLFYFNSCLNPVIYALFYPWFRNAVKLIVTFRILQPGSHEANIL